MSKKLTTAEFVRKAIKIHGNRYDYSKAVYTGQQEFVTLTCNTCKTEFEVRAQKHANNTPTNQTGCRKCNHGQGWGHLTEFKLSTRSDLKEKRAEYYVVILKHKDTDEQFLKCGFSSRFKYRVNNFGPYKVAKIVTRIPGTLQECFKMEQNLLSKVHKYKPTEKFSGSHECFLGATVEDIYQTSIVPVEFGGSK